MNLITRLVIMSTLTLLASCSNTDVSDLDAFMQSARERPVGQVEPIPVFKPYKAFAYASQAKRPPFERPAKVMLGAKQRGVRPDIKPDTTRPKEFLEQFDLETLTMVGTISNAEGYWVLIQDPEAGVHRVTRGNYIGRNYGRVLDVGDNFVSLLEIVPDGLGGWLERPKTVNLILEDK